MAQHKSTTKATSTAKAANEEWTCPQAQATKDCPLGHDYTEAGVPCHTSSSAHDEWKKARALAGMRAAGAAIVQQGIQGIAEGRTSSDQVMAAVEAVEAAEAKAAEAKAKPAAKPAATPAPAAGEKRCPGVPMLQLAPHMLPATTEAFTAKSTRKDGLSRRCKGCQKADRDARKARVAAGTHTVQARSTKPATTKAEPKAKRTAKLPAKPATKATQSKTGRTRKPAPAPAPVVVERSRNLAALPTVKAS